MNRMAAIMERMNNEAYSETDGSDPYSSDTSSLLDDSNTQNYAFGTQPYLFEPKAESDDEIDHEEATPDIERLGNNDWCHCSNCPPMPTVSESICCREISEVMAVMEEEPNTACITLHGGFNPVCLHTSELRTAYYVYRQQYEDIPETNGRMRYIAYRQLARWCWGWLGKQIRVPLPACAVHKIRTTFPEEDGQYKGFCLVAPKP